jgi:sugar lactone lactonase YvrE
VVAWSVALKNGHGSRSGLWILKDLAENKWDELVTPAPNAVLGVGCDSAGMTWDSKRDRLYLFNVGQKQKGRICYYDFKEKKVGWLEPEGAFPGEFGMGREPVYMPEHDLVLLASSAGKGSPITLIYDPEKNRWMKFEPDCEKDAKGRALRPAHGVSTGVMWDPRRKLLWASDVRGNVFVMKFDPGSAKLEELK